MTMTRSSVPCCWLLLLLTYNSDPAAVLTSAAPLCNSTFSLADYSSSHPPIWACPSQMEVKYLQLGQVCDGVRHCFDGSDEQCSQLLARDAPIHQVQGKPATAADFATATEETTTQLSTGLVLLDWPVSECSTPVCYTSSYARQQFGLAAHLFCRQLEFPTSGHYGSVQRDDLRHVPAISIDSIQCRGHERTLHQCIFNSYEQVANVDRSSLVYNCTSFLVVRCERQCDRILQNDAGSISSPGYPYYLLPNLVCTWLVVAPQHAEPVAFEIEVVHANLYELQLGLADDDDDTAFRHGAGGFSSALYVVDESCHNSWITLSLGLLRGNTSTSIRFKNARLCSPRIIGSQFTTTRPNFFVTFISNLYVGGLYGPKGFKLEYRIIPANETSDYYYEDSGDDGDRELQPAGGVMLSGVAAAAISVCLILLSITVVCTVCGVWRHKVAANRRNRLKHIFSRHHEHRPRLPAEVLAENLLCGLFCCVERDLERDPDIRPRWYQFTSRDQYNLWQSHERKQLPLIARLERWMAPRLAGLHPWAEREFQHRFRNICRRCMLAQRFDWPDGTCPHVLAARTRPGRKMMRRPSWTEKMPKRQLHLPGTGRTLVQRRSGSFHVMTNRKTRHRQRERSYNLRRILERPLNEPLNLVQEDKNVLVARWLNPQLDESEERVERLSPVPGSHRGADKFGLYYSISSEDDSHPKEQEDEVYEAVPLDPPRRRRTLFGTINWDDGPPVRTSDDPYLMGGEDEQHRRRLPLSRVKGVRIGMGPSVQSHCARRAKVIIGLRRHQSPNKHPMASFGRSFARLNHKAIPDDAYRPHLPLPPKPKVLTKPVLDKSSGSPARKRLLIVKPPQPSKPFPLRSPPPARRRRKNNSTNKIQQPPSNNSNNQSRVRFASTVEDLYAKRLVDKKQTANASEVAAAVPKSILLRPKVDDDGEIGDGSRRRVVSASSVSVDCDVQLRRQQLRHSRSRLYSSLDSLEDEDGDDSQERSQLNGSRPTLTLTEATSSSSSSVDQIYSEVRHLPQRLPVVKYRPDVSSRIRRQVRLSPRRRLPSLPHVQAPDPPVRDTIPMPLPSYRPDSGSYEHVSALEMSTESLDTNNNSGCFLSPAVNKRDSAGSSAISFDSNNNSSGGVIYSDINHYHHQHNNHNNANNNNANNDNNNHGDNDNPSDSSVLYLSVKREPVSVDSSSSAVDQSASAVSGSRRRPEWQRALLKRPTGYSSVSDSSPLFRPKAAATTQQPGGSDEDNYDTTFDLP